MKTNRDKVTIFLRKWRLRGCILLFDWSFFSVGRGQSRVEGVQSASRNDQEYVDPEPREFRLSGSESAPGEHQEDAQRHDEGRHPHPETHDDQHGQQRLGDRHDDEHGRRIDVKQ